MDARLLTAALSLGLGVSLGRAFRELLARRRSPTADPVPASAHLIAAWRALESLEPAGLRLFTDPFAAALAGGEAVQSALSLAQPWPVGTGSPSPSPPCRRLKLSNVAARVWWFDQQLLAALGAGQEQPQAQPQLQAASPPPAQPPRQVVVLGAGLDTRPWRLALPPGVRWLEADLPEMVAAKQALLARVGAALEASQAAGAAGSHTAAGGSPAAAAAAMPASAGAAAAGAAHPLRAASWAALPADLGRPGWAERLRGLGLDAGQPTVWVLEGLLMYLDEAQAATLLREMAGSSAPGSVLIAHNITPALLDLIEAGNPAAYAPFPPELVNTWKCGLPPANQPQVLAEALQAAGGWRLGQATSRARIGAQACAWVEAAAEQAGGGGSAAGAAAAAAATGAGAAALSAAPGGASSGGQRLTVEDVAARCDFEARPDEGRDAWAVFFVARL